MTKDELHARAVALGFDLMDVVSPVEFPTVPAWTQSVLILGMAALDMAYDLELYIEEGGRQRWSKWAYERILAGAARLAIEMSRLGRRAEPLSYDDSLALLDLKAAAVRAGLGVFGLNNLVVTRRFGPRVRFGAIFTEASLPEGKPLRDYYCTSCSVCIGACPTGALQPGRLDRSLCIAEFEPDALLARLQRERLQFPTLHTRLQCAACIHACPIGCSLHTRFWGLDPRR